MSLTIVVGDTESNILDDPKTAFTNMTLYAPTLGGVTTVMVSPKRASESVLADFLALQSGGADVVLTTDKATPLTVAGWGALLLKTDTTVSGADEVYEVTGTPFRG